MVDLDLVVGTCARILNLVGVEAMIMVDMELAVMGHLLDKVVGIAMQVYESIIHFSRPVQGKLYMPFCYVLTSFFITKGIDVTRGALHQLSKDFDQLGPRQISLAQIEQREGIMVWHRRPGQDDSESDDDAEEVPTPAAEPARASLRERVFYLEEFVREEFQSVRQQQTEMFNMMRCWDLAYQGPPPPPSSHDDASA
ncbi:hypothetical protein ZIOFF_045226 [Zingiber officinale]|uniref:Uncharacterized protein n=1 Tax=Zingiber officinale TaxID=94328 RepID=A0A8J5GCV8_ZINOF|nr:hypothetical protein ZIOFF_045226 [Zingiber officinale]